jgi:ABC-type multidrug transport system permease subunit
MPEYNHPVIELTVTRLKEFLRETEAIFWVFGFPLLLALALGFAFREKAPDRIPIGILDAPNAKQRLALLSRSPALLPRIYDPAAAEQVLRTGKVSLLVEGTGVVIYRFDATRPDSRVARLEADDALQAAAGRRNPQAVRDQLVTERGSRYIDFLIPGLLGMNIMGTGMWSVGFNVVNARTRKLLKRLIATPMRKSDYLAAQFLARLGFLFLEVITLLVFTRFVFGVRVNGSWLLLGAICVAGAMAFSGLGILIASRARTIEAVSGLMNVVMMPMWLCSGVFFSYERFPDAAKPYIRALPLTALNDALRGVMTEGLSAARVAPQLGIMLAWGVVSFFVGLKIFRWQ